MRGLEIRAARNVVIVAKANKLARIRWAVLALGDLSRLAVCRDLRFCYSS
jgi:hypothetical protein